MTWLWYILIGFAAGVISGMGIGGGTLLIPALGIFMNMGQREAQKINLLYFLPTATIALYTHKKNGNIEKNGLLGLVIFGLIGSVAGALIAIRVDANYLRKGFAVFLLVMSAYELYKAYENRLKLRQKTA